MEKQAQPGFSRSGTSKTGWNIDQSKIRNVIFDALCLIVVAEIITLLASSGFSWEVTFVTIIEVILFALLALLAKNNPYTSILSALVIFIVISIISAALKPYNLGGSIVIKIFILIYLVRAIPDARELQIIRRNEKQAQL
ncbi:MAG: hypothetical protein QM802_15075 [Agriterribacter sp.]